MVWNRNRYGTIMQPPLHNDMAAPLSNFRESMSG
jgi:hypothetical protein